MKDKNKPSYTSMPNIMKNPPISCNKRCVQPNISDTAFIHPDSSIIGDVKIGRNVMVAPYSSIRADEGAPFFIDDMSNIQDNVVIHALQTVDQDNKVIEERFVKHNKEKYAVYIGKGVSLAHQSQVHGPAYVGDNTFIAMQALVFDSYVGKDCVLEPKSGVIGVIIPDQRYVPAGKVITTQEEADNLPVIGNDYKYKTTNKSVVDVNINLCEGYSKL